jgi:hypothetical protein
MSLGTISYPQPFYVSPCSASRKINNFVLPYPSTMMVCFTMAQKQGSQQNMGWNLRNQDHSESFPIMVFLLGICHTTHTKKSNTKKKIESESETFSTENRKLWALAAHSLRSWTGSQQVKGSTHDRPCKHVSPSAPHPGCCCICIHLTLLPLQS